MLKPVENISDGFKIMSQMNDDELAMMCSGGFGTIPQTAETSEKCDNAVESDEEDFNESTLNKQSKKARVLQISGKSKLTLFRWIANHYLFCR